MGAVKEIVEEELYKAARMSRRNPEEVEEAWNKNLRKGRDMIPFRDFLAELAKK